MEARPPANVDEFAQLMVRSGLATEQQSKQHLSQFRSEQPFTHVPADGIQTFCCFLINAGYVTTYQCDKLKLGRWKGFYLDDYLILEQVGKGSDYCSYKARDTKDGELVCLVVTPSLLAGGRFKYRVEPYVE
jgi:hypothetical protein